MRGTSADIGASAIVLTCGRRTTVRGPAVVKRNFLALLCVNLTILVDAVMAEALASGPVVAQFGAL